MPLYSLDVTLNPDAQEAMSRHYYAWGILRLESGKYAIFNNHKLSHICDDPTEVDLVFNPNMFAKYESIPADLPSLDSILPALAPAPKPVSKIIFRHTFKKENV